jgi:hypothetical protein
MTRQHIAHTVTGVVLATSAALYAASAAAAAEPPVLKSGLWEVVRAGGAPGDPKHLTTMCLDDSVQAEMRDFGMGMAKNICSRNDRSFDGTRMVINAVCQMGPTTLTSKSIMTFKGNTAYHTDVTAIYDPPMMGTRESKVAIDAKWTGPCKAGQKAGDMTMENGQQINIKSFMTK